MTNYRLDRRFVLLSVGTHVMVAGVASALAFFLASVTALAWLFGLVALAALLNAVRLYAFPPVVARTDPGGLRIGRPLTAKPVDVLWLDVQDVATGSGRVVVDRGDGDVISFPLAYVGGRATELLRDIYDRLNAANGYRRFDPS